MMESQSRVDEESDLKIDEEDQFSAVSRILPSAINRFSQRRISHRNEAVVNNVGHQLSQVSIQASKCSSSEISTSNIIVNGNVTDSNPSTVNSTNRLPNQLSNDKSKLNDRFSEVSSQSNFSTIVSGTTPTQSKSIERVKKSTLDPNAPEFQPMGLAYVSVHSNPVATQAMQSSVIPTTHSIHVSQHYAAMTQSSHVPSQTAFIARSQFYAPVLPYAAQQTGQLQQLLSTPASVCIPGSIPQHMRGGSLPPSLNQQHFTQSAATNHGLNLLSQQHAQSGASFAQMITAPQSLVFAGNNSAVRLPVCPPSSSIGLTRQRSNDSPSSVSHPISYAIQQPVMSMTTFQPPVYQIPQGNGGIPFIVSGHHPLGLQLVPAGLPNAANSSPLMVGNVNVSQATNQQGYPGHTIMHMQPATHLQMPMAQSDQIPTPSTTPQQTIQSQQQQQQQMYSQHYQDHSHHIQVPSYAGPYHNLMFASQQGGGASNFYPTVAPSTMLTGPNAVNPSIASAAAAGLFPILGQPNYQQQHSMGANIQHQHNQMDPSQLLMNGQHHPHQMALTNNNQHHHHQLFQHQAAMAQAQLLQAHHMNNSHIPTANTYHAFIAAMSAAGGAAATGVGNATPQAH